MRYNRDVVFFLVLIFCCLFSTTAIPDICGDYDKCVECTNSNCNDSSKFLQNVCNNITSGCICKHGLTGSVCDQDCENGTYGIACKKNCDCGVMFCDKVNGCTNTEDNDDFTSSRQSPVTRGSVIPSTQQITLTSGTPQSRTDQDFGDGLPTDSISTGTIVAIVIASIFGITAFVMILLFMRKCTNVKDVKYTERSTNSSDAQLVSNGSRTCRLGYENHYIEDSTQPMTSESGDHGNNEYSYIGIDLSDSLDGIKMNSMQQDNYTEITDEDLNRTNKVSLSPTYKSPSDVKDRNMADTHDKTYSSVSNTNTLDGVYNVLNHMNNGGGNNGCDYDHVTTSDEIYNEIEFI